MRAIHCEKLGGPEDLVLTEADDPQPAPGEVLIEVRAAGVNFPDTLIIAGRYQFQPPLPFSPGSEVAGVIAAVGEGVSALSVGDRVAASFLFGGFVERICVPAERVVRLPDGVSFEAGASFPMVYGTSLYALKDRARLQAGETLLVLGAAGGVGLAAVDIGRQMGARVIAAASTPEKLALCQKYGAEAVINYREEDLKKRVKALTNGRGADVIYDPVGGPASEQALRACAWEGRFLVVGFAAGAIPKIPLNLVLLKSCQMVGVFWGAFTMRDPAANAQNTRHILEQMATGGFTPHIHARYSLDEAARALQDITARRVMGKIVLVP